MAAQDQAAGVERVDMKIETFLLTLLSGIGWACGFAIVGLALFRAAPSGSPHLPIFALFGFGAGVALAALRLGIERRLPRSLSTPERRAARSGAQVGAAGIRPADGPRFVGSIFGA